MTSKRTVWIGAIVGSTIGGMLPSLWHASWFSMSSMLFSTIGAISGIGLGWKLGRIY